MSQKTSQSLTTQIKILDERAELPSKAHESDTGYDLKFIDIHKISGDVIFFRTGLSLAPPTGYYFEVFPRSSISNLPLQQANSVAIIDEHYRGELLVPIRVMHPNMGQHDTLDTVAGGIVKIFSAKPQTMTALAQQILMNKPKLCQLVLRKKVDCGFEVVEELSETQRGSGGFGSTDSKKVLSKE